MTHGILRVYRAVCDRESLLSGRTHTVLSVRGGGAQTDRHQRRGRVAESRTCVCRERRLSTEDRKNRIKTTMLNC